jgi:hypothetical protein
LGGFGWGRISQLIALAHDGSPTRRPNKFLAIAHFCDSVTDNFRVISPKNFGS